MSASLAIVMALWFLPKVPLLLSLGSVTFLFLIFELTRLRVSGINRWFISHFGSMLREEEKSGLTTSNYVLLAALVSYIAFGRDIAVLSVSFLAIGDVAAAIVGHQGCLTEFLVDVYSNVYSHSFFTFIFFGWLERGTHLFARMAHSMSRSGRLPIHTLDRYRSG